MYEKMLETLAKDMAAVGRAPQPPASEREISSLVIRAREGLGLVVPDEYLQFLREANGVRWNGCFLYGSDPENVHPGLDLVEQNRAWRGDGTENLQFTYLGESSISWFVYDTEDDTYKVLDLPTGDEMNRLNGFADLAQAIVNNAVGLDIWGFSG